MPQSYGIAIKSLGLKEKEKFRV